MGVSPLQYQRALRAGRLRSALKQGESVTDAIYTAGFESPSRAYEGAQLGMTPARFAQGGKGEEIRWAVGPSPFGWVIVGETGKGLCWLSLGATPAEAEAGLRAEFPAATLRPDPSLSQLVDAALACVREGSRPRQPQPHRRTGPARHRVSTARLAGPAPDPPRRNPQLQPARPRTGRPQRHPRRGPGLRHQPGGSRWSPAIAWSAPAAT